MTVRKGSCLVFILLAVSTSSYKCPENNPDDELSFLRPPASVVFVREGQYKMVHCCATGYTSMTWLKHYEDGYSPYAWYVGDDNVQQQQGNQTLRIFRARKIKDGGFYKCVAKKDGHVIQHEVMLNVIECEMKNNRIDITQKPTGPIMAEIDERREITCEGNFGCLSGDLIDRSAEWRYQNKDSGGHWVFNNSRFTVQNYNKYNGTIVGKKLVIKRIQPEDYNTVYSCILQTPKVGSRTGFNVTIIPPETKQNWYWMFLLLVPVVVIVICLIFYCLYRHRIDYFFRRVFRKLPDRGKVKNDILLLYNDDDKTFVQNYFKPQFKDYTIFDRHCVLPGRMEIGELQENVLNSYATVIIYTPAFLEDKQLCYVFDFAKTRNFRIYIVQIKQIPKNSVPDSILKLAPSIFTTIKWPWKDPENSRKVTNFYCKLKKNLPRKLKQRDCESSDQPLLESTLASSNVNDEDEAGSEEPEVRHTRSANIPVMAPPSTESQISRDSGISSPLSMHFNPGFPDIKSLSVTTDKIERMV